MSQTKGFTDLRIAEDLLVKLNHDRARMNNDPNDVYAAFDFFVTAEHIVDWVLPDTTAKKQRKEREKLRSSEPILALVSHIASGAKHFEATARQHQSVDDLEMRQGGFSPSAFSTSAFSPKAFKFSGITVELSDGTTRHVFEIADEVIAYWTQELGA